MSNPLFSVTDKPFGAWCCPNLNPHAFEPIEFVVVEERFPFKDNGHVVFKCSTCGFKATSDDIAEGFAMLLNVLTVKDKEAILKTGRYA